MKNKSGLSITNGFKIVLGEHRKPEKLWVERGSEFYNKTIKSLLKNETGKDGSGINETASQIEQYSTYSVYKAVHREIY